MDKDLEFLNGCSNEQLQVLADSIAFDDQGRQRHHETLTTRKNYKLYYPKDMKKLLPDIVDELSLYGGNSIRNRIVGHGESYRNILEDVCDKYKVKYNSFDGGEEIEGFDVKKVLLVAAEDMSTEDVKHISEQLNTKEDLNNVIKAGKLSSPIIIRMTTVLVYRMFSRIGAKVAARFVAIFAGSRLFAILTGPTGWVIGGLWTAYDLLGPSYKVTVPCTILIAYYRILSQKTDGELKEILE